MNEPTLNAAPRLADLSDHTPMMQTPPAILDRESAAAFDSLSTAQFERKVAAGRFPKPRQVSKRRTGWLHAELLAAALALPISDLQPHPGQRRTSSVGQPE
jgi:predicted DNA-binding transcriptional regulator AlpA